MREVIQKLNKATLAQDTGVSYSRLRKFASGVIDSLNNEEIEKIYNYLLLLARRFKL